MPPIYEFECPDCGNICEEIMKSFKEANDFPPICQHGDPENYEKGLASPMTRKMANTSFVLKGSGWYSDGYSSKKNKKG